MIEVGDKVKVGYFHDCHPNNNKTGIIISISEYKYYPDGDINEHIIKRQAYIRYDRGIEEISDLDSSVELINKGE